MSNLNNKMLIKLFLTIIITYKDIYHVICIEKMVSEVSEDFVRFRGISWNFGGFREISGSDNPQPKYILNIE